MISLGFFFLAIRSDFEKILYTFSRQGWFSYF